jgi:hypothetical protein
VLIMLPIIIYKASQAVCHRPEAVLGYEHPAMDVVHRRYPTVPHLGFQMYRDLNSNYLTKCLVNYIT